jgi:hypothetical protein
MTNTKVKFIVEFTSWVDNTKSILSTVVNFEDRKDCIYYTYQFRDENNNMLGGKSQSISKRIIDTDELKFSIKYATHSIDNFRVNRKRIFKVIETGLA